MPPDLALVPAPAPFARVAPHDELAEQSFLSAVLQEPNRIDDVAGMLRPEDFYVGKHRRLYALILHQRETTGAVDLVTLRSAVAAAGEECCEVEYLHTIALAAASPHNAKRYAEVIVARSRQRAFLAVASELQQAAHDQQDPAAILEMARSLLSSTERSTERDPSFVRDLLDDAFAEICSSTASIGYSTGYVQLDSILGGMEPGQVVLIAARTSMGKSALGLNIGARVASQAVPVGYLSFEMTRKQLLRRLLSCFSGVPMHRLKGGTLLSEQEHDRLNEAAVILRECPIVIDDAEACSPETLRARSRRLVEKHGAKLLVIDHLHLMKAPDRDRTIRSQVDKMTAVSAAVKGVAKELDVPILAMAQLNREAAKQGRQTNRKHRHDEDEPEIAKPILTDLRDSGSLEQDADAVLLLHRDAYYTKNRLDRTAEVIVAKNRDGATGTAKLSWIEECQRFEDVTFPSQR